MKYMNLLLFVLFILFAPSVDRASAVVEYTDYEITLKEAIEIQLNAEATPITDIYRDSAAYIHINDIRFDDPKVAVLRANVREEPSFKSGVTYQFPKNVPLHIVGIEEDINPLLNEILQKEESKRWYKIAYQTNTYFVHESDVQMHQVRTKKDAEVRQGPSSAYHSFGKLEQNESLTISETGTEWLQVAYKSWRTPKAKDMQKHLQPDEENDNMFQHIRLDATIEAPATELNQVLEGKGILEGLGEAFIAGGEAHGINEAYLIAHALLESGHGTSNLATGVEVGLDENKEATIVTDANRDSLSKIKTTYNMFGIGAADSCPLECGAKTAYENKWFTPEAAVEDGAEWIGKGYIYNEFEQNTLYKMKWNPKMGEGQQWKQYATDIGWAEKQTTRIKEIYEQLTDPLYMYDVPAYAEK